MFFKWLRRRRKWTADKPEWIWAEEPHRTTYIAVNKPVLARPELPPHAWEHIDATLAAAIHETRTRADLKVVVLLTEKRATVSYTANLWQTHKHHFTAIETQASKLLAQRRTADALLLTASGIRSFPPR